VIKVDFKRAFHKAYLRQQGMEEVTEKTIRNYSVDPARLVLLEETDTYWIIKVLDDGMAGEFLDVVYKDSFEMDTLEIR
jgi:hypothetical protein